MSRSRNIKPGFFRNDVLGECPATTRLLFIGLWCEADREGRLEYRPKRIRATCLPYDDVDVEGAIAELVERGFLFMYEAEGSQYIQVVNWAKHQNPHHKEVGSCIPAPDGEGCKVLKSKRIHAHDMDKSCIDHGQVMHGSCMDHGQVMEIASCPTDSLIPDSLIPDSVQEQKRQRPEQRKAPPPAAVHDFKSDLFARWKALPNGGGGAFLNKLFRDHKPEQRVVEAVERTLDDTRADPKAFVLGVLTKHADGEDREAELWRNVK